MNSLEELQATFIRNVEHELRTPLSIMQGYAELLRDGELGQLAPEQQQALLVIVDRAYEMRKLVERIGVLLEAQSRRNTCLPLSLSSLIAEAVKERQADAAQAGLTVQVSIEPDLPSLPGDPYQLAQAFDCLLENAIKFTPSGGQINVHAYSDSGWVCYSVSDTGIGIPEDKLTKLLNGFYQVDGSTTRHFNGIGLGLTVAKAVVDTYKGRIEIESHPGQGSRFTIRLPRSSPEAEDGPPQGNTAAMRRILVVDDEENVALTLQSGLERLPNCEVAIATSGEEALQLFAQRPFDLMVTDYKMPDTDGMTLAVRIRQAYPATSIVMITAYMNDDLLQQAAHASIHSILDKPVKLAEVRSAALEALGQAAVSR
jgi:CheY-like chemotaxis protein/two-component sensor histidine kinase